MARANGAHGYRAVLSAPRMALNGTVIRTGTIAILLCSVILCVFTYLAVLADPSIPLLFAWRKLRLFPWLADLRLNPVGTFVQTTGKAIAGLVLLYSTGAQVKTLFRHAKGDVSFSAHEAWHSGRANSHALVTAIALLILVATGTLLSALALGLPGRIPVAGEIFAGFGFLLALPLVFLLLVCLALIAGTLTVGVAIANTLDDDWLGTLVNVGALLWSQWWRFLVYEGIVFCITIASWLAATGLLFTCTGLAIVLVGLTTQGRLAAVAYVASQFVPGLDWVLSRVVPQFDVWSIVVGPGVAVGGAFVSFGILFLLAVVTGYAAGVWSAGQMATYAELRRHQYSQDIFEKEDMIDRVAALAPTLKSGRHEAGVIAPSGERKDAGDQKPPAS